MSNPSNMGDYSVNPPGICLPDPQQGAPDPVDRGRLIKQSQYLIPQ